MEPRDAKRMNHAVGTAREHHVGLAPADRLHRLADGLGAGHAGGREVGVRPPGSQQTRYVAGRRSRLQQQIFIGRAEATGLLDELVQLKLLVRARLPPSRGRRA